MTDKQTAPQQAGELVEVENFAPQASLLDSIISQSRVARSDTERNRTRDLIGELVNQVLEGEMTPTQGTVDRRRSIRRIAEIDAMLSVADERNHARPSSSSSWKPPGAA
ncbi:EvpB family type VI secretion protein [Pseudomonas putida S11]|nr:EvpB family type VI secretion protein [Pseudomonas putida S11]